MQDFQTDRGNSSLVGVFTDLTAAYQAVDELKALGLGGSVRVIENDLSEQMDPSRGEDHSESDNQSGISGFFARLFGFDDERSSLGLNSDSEVYFRDSYQNKHHLVIVEGSFDEKRCREILMARGAVIEDEASALYERERSGVGAESDVAVMELREELLEIGKEKVQIGEVHIRKEMVHDVKTVQVPVMREELVIETRSLSGAAYDGSLSSMDSGATREIRIPVSEEQILVSKKVMPREEIRVSKSTIVDNQEVTADLIREEAVIEEDGRVAMSDKDQDRLKTKAKVKPRYENDDLHPAH